MPFIDTEGPGKEDNDIFAFCAAGNSLLIQHEKNGRINRVVPFVEKKCIFTGGGRIPSGSGVPATRIVNNTSKLKSRPRTITLYFQSMKSNTEKFPDFRRPMKNKRLRVIRQTDKQGVIFRPEDCLNYIKPNRKTFLKNPFHSEDPLPESKGNDHDLRERYRI
jgi:hypothetical protein